MFVIDQQTLSDLNAIDRSDGGLWNFFDNTTTVEGRYTVYRYFLNPLNNIEEVRNRQEAIIYLSETNLEFPFDKFMMDDLERYLNLPNEPYSESYLSYYLETLSANVFSLNNKRIRQMIKRSVCEIGMLIRYLSNLLESAVGQGRPIGVLNQFRETFIMLTEDLDFDELKKMPLEKISLTMLIKYDYKFRNLKKSQVRSIFAILYELDALRGISRTFRRRQLVFPNFYDGDEPPDNMLRIGGLYNLFIDNPTKNDVEIQWNKNIWFLTGANMTGKSTLLKTVGTCVYLAHLGFPVPALEMDTHFFDGLLTTINLGDDIVAGHSHFFNEVRRIKKMAETLAEKQRMIIILDEAFKGTNYNDAYQATHTLIEHFEDMTNAIFFISSHITELSSALNKDRVAFKYLKTDTNGESNIKFTYQLVSGVAEEKLGMWLLQREKIFEILKSIVPNQG
jgi:DNA mismatch repair protein MutS